MRASRIVCGLDFTIRPRTFRGQVNILTSFTPSRLYTKIEHLEALMGEEVTDINEILAVINNIQVHLGKININVYTNMINITIPTHTPTVSP